MAEAACAVAIEVTLARFPSSRWANIPLTLLILVHSIWTACVVVFMQKSLKVLTCTCSVILVLGAIVYYTHGIGTILPVGSQSKSRNDVLTNRLLFFFLAWNICKI